MQSLARIWTGHPKERPRRGTVRCNYDPNAFDVLWGTVAKQDKRDGTD